MTRIKSFLDMHTERFISRKFLAWLTATGLTSAGLLTGDEWVAITLAYIGTQAVVDAAAVWKHGNIVKA